MKSISYFTLLLGLHGFLLSVLHADLLPGDIALTRIQSDEIVLLALKDIPAGETIEITDSFWVNGAFDDSGTTGTITIPSEGLAAGSQLSVDLAPFGMVLNFGETLHFYQNITPVFTSNPRTRHLLLIEFNKDGLRWWRNIPGGLLDDVTHIVIPELAPGQAIGHIIKQDFLTDARTPYEWMSAFGSYLAWTDPQNYSPSELFIFASNSLTVLPDAGIVSFPFERQNLNEQAGTVYVPVRRSFGSSGAAQVTIKATNIIEPLRRWDNLSPDNFAVDMTDVAWGGTGNGLVAVSPQSGKLLINDGSGWVEKATNGNSTINLKLSGIMHDGFNFWACSLNGKIFSSSDGEYWNEKYDNQNGNQKLFGIFYLPNAPHPYVAVGENGCFLYSTDGFNWSNSPTFFPGKLYAAGYFDGEYVLVGEGGTVLYNDLPSSISTVWQTAPSPTSKDLYALSVVNFGSTDTLYAVGKDGVLITSDDLTDGLTKLESGTKRSLYDIKFFELNSNGTKYLMAIGANGVATLSENGEEFIRTRFLDRAPALYALTCVGSASANAVFAVGEYGSVVSFKVNSQNLSGALGGIELDDTMSTVSTNTAWGNGNSGEKYIKFSKANAIALFRARVDLQLEYPAGQTGLFDYQIGQSRTTINLWRKEFSAANAMLTRLVENYGPQVYLKDVSLNVVNDDEWVLNFKVRNNSNSASNRLFIRFEGTNLADWDVPNVSAITNRTIAALSESGTISVTLRQPIEYISLYEEFRTGEVVKKYSVAINSLVADSNWVPNGIFPRSLGAYLNDHGNLSPIELPFSSITLP
ncbi:MAG: WD40/YVTN/BNR-like repeat-containing protein [Opitutaceae bacterium]